MTQFSVFFLRRGLILVLALQLCPHFFHEHLKYVSTNYPEVFIIGQSREERPRSSNALLELPYSHLGPGQSFETAALWLHLLHQ